MNRQALSPEDRQARALLTSLARARRFAVQQDQIANLFITRPGRAGGPPVMIGSHLDSQIAGGRYDGALGTLAAFEVLEALDDAGVVTPCPVTAVAWTNEEGSRFAPGCMGSAAFADKTVRQAWLEVRDADGIRLGDALAETLAALKVPVCALGSPVRAYLEVHIEQGPVLEAEGIAIGAVEAVQGTRWLEVTLTGRTAHAGTTERAYRRDALAAATEAIHALHASLMPADPMARFTVGRLSIAPGSINAIPETVVFTVDIRHPDPAGLDALEAAVRARVGQAAGDQGCRASIAGLFDMAPCRFDARLVQHIEAAAARCGLRSRRMVSGAFHDALFLGRTTSSAMIFVPSRDGISHNEAEFTSGEHCVAGAEVLLGTVEALLAEIVPGV